MRHAVSADLDREDDWKQQETGLQESIQDMKEMPGFAVVQKALANKHTIPLLERIDFSNCSKSSKKQPTT